MSAPPLTREQFLALMAIEASKLERLARQLREGKWGKFDIEESIDRKGVGSTEEKATIVVRASRIQGRGTGLDITLVEEPALPHHFEGSWQPHPEKRGIEHERYEVICSGCGLNIINPTDAYPVDHCPAVQALTPEWLELMSYPKECVPKVEKPPPEVKKRPYERPTLRKLEPHEVIRKLNAALEKESR